MEALKKTLVLGTSSILALSGVGGVALAAAQADEGAQVGEAAQASAAAADGEWENGRAALLSAVSLDKVVGQFSFTQTEVSSNADILKNIGEASSYLCGNRGEVGDGGTLDAHDWGIEVKGDVQSAYTATFDELCETDAVQSLLLGCACAGNPADGIAAANAEVTGVSALVMVQMAEPQEGANTVVFTSADGYEVALPLSYIQMHYCPVVYDVNGAPLAESMGGTNQLWLGSTAASYFARDIVSITVETRDEAPANPNSDEARASYANLPNVGVLFGGTVQ